MIDESNPDYDQMLDDCNDAIFQYIEDNNDAYSRWIVSSTDWVPYGSTNVSMTTTEVLDDGIDAAMKSMWEEYLINYNEDTGKYESKYK